MRNSGIQNLSKNFLTKKSKHPLSLAVINYTNHANARGQTSTLIFLTPLHVRDNAMLHPSRNFVPTVFFGVAAASLAGPIRSERADKRASAYLAAVAAARCPERRAGQEKRIADRVRKLGRTTQPVNNYRVHRLNAVARKCAHIDWSAIVRRYIACRMGYEVWAYLRGLRTYKRT